MMGWQWHQLDHMQMQIICTSLQTDKHASSSPLCIDVGFPTCSDWNYMSSSRRVDTILPLDAKPIISVCHTNTKFHYQCVSFHFRPQKT